MKNKLTFLKDAISMIASAGASAAITAVIQGNVPADSTKINKALIGVGTFVLSEVGASLAMDYVEDQYKGLLEEKVQCKGE